MPAAPPDRDFALEVVRRLRTAGHEALWAGGCVRDQLLGLAPKDYDIATSAHPDQVRQLFRRTVAVGASFGVVEIIGPRPDPDGPPLMIQVATFRSDGSYSDGRRPDAVVFSSAKDDAERRDFTINGMFYDPLEDRLIDYVGGQADLKAKILRAIGDPHKRFAEDKLRMLRAVRLITRFHFSLDPATADAIREHAASIAVVSAERVADELRKMLLDPHRSAAMLCFIDLGLAAVWLPELVTLAQDRAQFWHVVLVGDCLGPMVSFPLAFAGLLYKLERRKITEICLRLKLSNEERERVEWLVEHHQSLCDVRQMRLSAVKQLLAHPNIRELIDLHRAYSRAHNQSADHVLYCEELLTQWTKDDLAPPPLLTGHDLTRLGLEPGPRFKQLLDAVREAQLDGTIGNQSDAEALVEQLCRKGDLL